MTDNNKKRKKNGTILRNSENSFVSELLRKKNKLKEKRGALFLELVRRHDNTCVKKRWIINVLKRRGRDVSL